MEANTQIGLVKVFTTEHRGYTPEEMADRAAGRLLRINNLSELKRVLTGYFKEVQDSERASLRTELVKNGFADAAKLLGD